MTAFQPPTQALSPLWGALACFIYRLSSNWPHCLGEHPQGAVGPSHICLWVMPTVQPMKSFTAEANR